MGLAAIIAIVMPSSVESINSGATLFLSLIEG
jgi:hypothetical protein